MIYEPTPRPTPVVAFDVWKQRFRHDCQRCDKLYAFDAFGDPVLQLLWESGLEPSVRAIVEDIPEAA